MKKKNYLISDEEYKLRLVKVLLSFREVCNRFGLRYYIAYGTLLGAVRHQGFIPWDDDIDVLMPRKDYEILRSLAPELKNADYELLDYSQTKGYHIIFMKYADRHSVILPSRFNNGLLYGINMDIFPLDWIDGPNGETAHREIMHMKYNLIKHEKSVYRIAELKSGTVQSLIKRYVKRGLYYIHRKEESKLPFVYQEIEQKLIQRNTENGPFAVYMYDRQDAFWLKKDFTGTYDDVSDLIFEDHHFCGPADPHAVLTKVYGEYMKLPPIEKRVSMHTYMAYQV